MTDKKRGKLSVIIAIAAVVLVMSVSMITFMISYVIMARQITSISGENAKDSLNNIQTQIDAMLDESAKMAESFASSEDVIAAVEQGDADALLAAIDEIYQISGMGTDGITITDGDGVVIARYYSDKRDDSIADLTYVQKALKGETTTAVATGSNIKFGARTGMPIKNSEGNIIGVASITYPLDDEEFIDGIKGESLNEYTLFMGDERINTTVMNGGERAIGTAMDSEIAEHVLTNGETYVVETEIMGSDYMAAYKPIYDGEGEVVGAMFSGVHYEDIKAQRVTSFITILCIALVVTVISTIAAIALVNSIIVKPLHDMKAAAENMAKGKLEVSIKRLPNNEIGDLGQSIAIMSENLKTYIHDVSRHVDKIASGDLTDDVSLEYIGDFVSLKESINKIIKALNTTLSSINTAADQVNSGADQVANAAQSLSQGATQQASSIQQLTSSIISVSDQVNENAKNVEVASGYVKESQSGIQSSNEYMQQMVAAMNEINESSSEISKIIKVIDDIAFQTNILALNAAVEAARAGAAGKGFSVVADEVRNLASKSADAAKQTTLLIEGSITSVEKGAEIAQETAKALEEVQTQSAMVVETIEKIQIASNNQAEAINQITTGLEHISQVVQTNSATAEESAAASEELSGQAQMLQQEISQFNLKGTSNSVSANAKPVEKAEKAVDFKPEVRNTYVKPAAKPTPKPAVSKSAAPKTDPSVARPSTPISEYQKPNKPLTIDLDDDKY